MKSFSILLFILYSTGLYAYQTDDSWYPGKVKLLNGTELIGDIHYNLGNQIARVRINGQTTSLQEAELNGLVIFIEKFRHEFTRVNTKNERGEVATTFAKLIYRSRKEFSLYKEYFVVNEDFDINPATGIPSNSQQSAELKNDAFMPNPRLGIRMDYRFFLADSEGKDLPISARGFRNAYGLCFEKINNFKIRNRLNIRKESDLVRMIRYADSLPGGCSRE